MEQWRTIITDNSEVWDNYEVSNYGRVRTLNWRNSGEIRLLKQHNNGHGYLRVHLCKNGRQKWFQVHRLVAFAWIPNDDPINKTVVNHLDENPLNCHVSNLQWTTQLENVRYGTAIERQRVNHTNGKTSKKVVCIETGKTFESINEVYRQLGLRVQACLSGTCKTCGGLHWQYYKDYLIDINDRNEQLLVA